MGVLELGLYLFCRNWTTSIDESKPALSIQSNYEVIFSRLNIADWARNQKDFE